MVTDVFHGGHLRDSLLTGETFRINLIAIFESRFRSTIQIDHQRFSRNDRLDKQRKLPLFDTREGIKLRLRFRQRSIVKCPNISHPSFRENRIALLHLINRPPQRQKDFLRIGHHGNDQVR